MCVTSLLKHKCRHLTVHDTLHCREYEAQSKKRNSGASFFKALFTPKPPDCGKPLRLIHDVRSYCSRSCAKQREGTLKEKQREWQRRQRDKQVSSREEREAKNKQKEKEALRLQKQEDERRARIVRYNEKKSKSKGKQPDVRASIRPLWETARGGTDVRLQPPQQPPQQQLPPTGMGDPRAPPRLGDRQILPQTYPQVPVYLQPFPLQSSRARRRSPSPPPPRNSPRPHANNFPFQGRPRSPSSANRGGSSSATVARSNGQHLRREDEGTVHDPRVRIAGRPGPGRPAAAPAPTPRQHHQQQQRPATQTVAAKKPVTVGRTPTGVFRSAAHASVVGGSSSSSSSSPAPRRAPQGSNLHRPTAASQARAQQQQQQQQQQRPQVPSPRRRSSVIPPPVPPKDHPPAIPAKSPWRPQNPGLAPAPLAVRSRAQVSPPATRPAAPPPQGRAVRPPPPPAPPRAPQQQQPAPRVYRSHRPTTMTTVPARKPVAAARPQQRSPPAGVYRPNPMFANNNRRQTAQNKVSGSASSRRPQQVGGSSKPEKKKGWLSRLVGGNGSSESVEWVSRDAARVERGE